MPLQCWPGVTPLPNGNCAARHRVLSSCAGRETTPVRRAAPGRRADEQVPRPTRTRPAEDRPNGETVERQGRRTLSDRQAKPISEQRRRPWPTCDGVLSGRSLRSGTARKRKPPRPSRLGRERTRRMRGERPAAKNRHRRLLPPTGNSRRRLPSLGRSEQHLHYRAGWFIADAKQAGRKRPQRPAAGPTCPARARAPAPRRGRCSRRAPWPAW